MRVTIHYKARMTWTERDLTYHENLLCDVTHEIEKQDDSTWKTINLDWQVCASKEKGE